MEKKNLSEKNHIKGKRIFDIVSWVIVSILFITSLILLIAKKSNGSLAIFGNRYDVVLSDSMSKKNEKYKDFLEGHDDQIQKMDVVRSKNVDKNTELNVYDIILFEDKTTSVGTNMHRIVDKRVLRQDEVYLFKSTVDESNHIILNNSSSALYTNKNIIFNYVEIEFQSTVVASEFLTRYHFAFDDSIEMTTEISTVTSGSYYIHKVKATSSVIRPGKFGLLHATSFDYSSDIINSVYIDSTHGSFTVTGSSFTVESEDTYKYFTNTEYEYETRGDAANTADGWITIDKIYSKVNKIIPKAGYFVSYITSTPGIIMIAGLGLLILGVDFGLEFIDKKEKQKKRKTVYFLTNWDGCSYELTKDDKSHRGEATLVGEDRFGAHIYEVKIDTEKYNQISFFYKEEKIEPIKLDDVESGTGFYIDENGLHSYMHKADKKKGEGHENTKK